MKKKEKKEFNPDDYDINLTIQDVANKFEHLALLDYSEVSLSDEIGKLNYEVISSAYEDFKYSKIEDYYDIEVDEIV